MRLPKPNLPQSMSLTIEKIRELSRQSACRALPVGRKKKHRKARKKTVSKRFTKKFYAKYLRSDHWRKFRSLVFARRGRRCEECGTTMNLEVHHKTYANLWHEKLEDVQILCRFHHSLVDASHMKKSGYAFLAR